MPIVIDDYESDGEGGFYIKWTDPSQAVTAHIHATAKLLGEFIEHFRTHRGAPAAKLEHAIEGFLDESLPDAARVQRFRLAYSELLEDIIDLRESNLKASTPYAVHQHVRGGGKPDKKWLLKDNDEFLQFVGRG